MNVSKFHSSNTISFHEFRDSPVEKQDFINTQLATFPPAEELDLVLHYFILLAQ
jgi:hypothetical protein